MSSAIAQLGCFPSISRTAHLRTRSSPCTYLRPKVLVIKSSDGRVTNVSTSENIPTISYSVDASGSHDGSSLNSNPATKPSIEGIEGIESSEPVIEQITDTPKSGAKIHDFCFGIPYGGIVLSGGLIGFVFSRNISTLSSGVLFGGALLALSVTSLKVWGQGKSSLPFILGQAVLAATLLWKNIQTYSLSKKIFPTVFYAVMSAAMLCFYSYVVLSGGNPPPKKKLKQSVATSSQ